MMLKNTLKPRFTLLSLLICSAVSLGTIVGCRTKEKIAAPVTGCMDITAINYDATATVRGTCTYPNSHLAGNYLVSDTLISFRHDATTGWYDTAISQFTIHATLDGRDTLFFDTLIRCNGGCSSRGGVRISGGGFYYSNFDPYNPFSGSGGFSNGTLNYRIGCTYMGFSGSYYHKGRGIKQ